MAHIATQTFALSPYNGNAKVTSMRLGVIGMEPPRPKVAIIGAGHGREYAPYDDPDWEVWGVNAVPTFDRCGRLRADRWFEMHIMAVQSELDMQWITNCPVPIYLVPSASRWEAPEYNPQQLRYPVELVERRFGGYFACSFAYQIALALLEQKTDIGLYGTELAYGTERERTVEWACVSWWIGLAEGRGVNIHLPPHSLLGQHRYRYGIEYHEEKRYVESYIDMLRKYDKVRNVDTTRPYNSGDDFSQGG